MKYSLLSAALFAGAIALPNHHAPRDEVHAGLIPVDTTSSSSDVVVTAHITKSTTVWYSGSDSATETTQEKTSATTTTEKPAATNAEICDGGMNRENWKKHKLDSMMSFFMNSYPKNMHGPKPQNDAKRSFLDYIADQVGESIGCDVDSECHITTDNPEKCKGERGDDLSPDLHFILWNIQSLHDWARSLYLAIKDSGNSWSSRSNELMTTFTNSKATSADDSDSTALNIAGSALALVGPLMVACAPAGVAAGVGSGAVLIGANTVSATQDTAAEILNKDFKTAATLEESITKITSVSAEAIRDVAYKAINEEISTDGEYPGDIWSTYSWSAPTLFENGTFADRPDAQNYKIAEKQFDNTIASAAINQAWRIDKTFIVKAKTIRSKPASELKLLYLDDDARICEQDGTCYFFVIAQNLKNTWRYKGMKWSNTKDLDKMGNYQIDKLQFAKDAEWFQKNSDESAPDPKELAELWKNPDWDGKSYKYFVNLPVIDYEKTTTITDAQMKWPFKARGMSPEARFLMNVGYYVDSGKFKNWPKSYNKMS